MMEPSTLWQQILSELEARLPAPAYSMISTQLHLSEADDEQLILGVPSTFAQRNIEKNRKDLEDAVFQVLGRLPRVQITVEKKGEGAVGADLPSIPTLAQQQHLPAAMPRAAAQRPEPLPHNLNDRYTFENFVVGSHNKFAHATALRVAETPGDAYNPLFLYGGVGLGKTHLMHAIGNQILQHRDDFRVMYISSERFTNELVNAFKDNRALEFRSRYRSVDLLLIDDIQFIAGKEATQEEFFHTFNELYGASKQIVISSDKHPNEISTLENRLRSRFQMGLITDIQAPDFETRIAILKKKAEMEDLEIPDEVLHLISRVYKSNVRELEGALTKIMAYTSMTGTQPTLALAQSVLGQMPDRDINAALIQEITANHFSKTVEELMGPSRSKDINFARQIAIYLCSELTDLSTPKIGECFGNRDHTTIIHSRDKIRELVKNDPKTQSIVNGLIARLK